MSFDFVLLLVIATVVTGAVLVADRLSWRRHRPQDQSEPALVEYSRALFPLLLVVVLIRSFLVEPFRIPSGSMIPTLHVGDFIMVDKTAFGLRIPDLGLTLIPGDQPERGDVVVFRYPPDPGVRYIKRIIGLPGDRVIYRDGQLYLNGAAVPRVAVGSYGGPRAVGAELYTETLGAIEHGIIRIPERDGREDDFIVPEGHYYVLGDNRDASNDSRSWGPVPESHLIGRAMFVWLSWAPGESPDWQRAGRGIR
jgi:signal peptidase I